MRRQYTHAGLTEADAGDDPITLFARWFNAAVQANPGNWYEPNVMSLATVKPNGAPAVRIVLLKGFDAPGLTFFTNYHSDKANHIAANPNVALALHWAHLERQVRITGRAEKIGRTENETYFATRPRGSQLGAWVSDQSAVTDAAALKAEFDAIARRFEGVDVPCPDHWGGYRVAPDTYEFWQGRPNRLHDRIRFTRTGNGWQRDRLAP